MELHLDLNKQYTFADYLTWIDDKSRELINGFIRMMSPAPSRIHQEIGGKFYLQIGNYLANKKCKLYHAPFDVRLSNNEDKENDKIFTVVQPDICIVCDLSKLDDRGCLGAPDLIIEIVSPQSSQRDVKEKFLVYEQSGVKEYWLARPYDKTLEVFLLSDQLKYNLFGIFVTGDKVPVNIFNGDLQIDLSDIFENT